MRTAGQVEAFEARLAGSGTRAERAGMAGRFAMGAAIVAAVLALLGQAWFAVGAGVDYPEPAALAAR